MTLRLHRIVAVATHLAEARAWAIAGNDSAVRICLSALQHHVDALVAEADAFPESEVQAAIADLVATARHLSQQAGFPAREALG